MSAWWSEVWHCVVWMPYFHSTACLELWFVRSLAWRGHFLSAVLESLYHNTDWQERKGEKEKKKDVWRERRRVENDCGGIKWRWCIEQKSQEQRCYLPQEHVSFNFSHWVLCTGPFSLSTHSVSHTEVSASLSLKNRNNQAQADFLENTAFAHVQHDKLQMMLNSQLLLYPFQQPVEGIPITANLFPHVIS